SVWRQDEDYIALKKEWGELDIQRITDLVTAYRLTVLDGAKEAWDVMRAGLEAVDEDGNPNWYVQLRAAEAMLKFAETAAGLNVKEATGGAQAAAAAVIVISRDHPEVVRDHADIVIDEHGE